MYTEACGAYVAVTKCEKEIKWPVHVLMRIRIRKH